MKNKCLGYRLQIEDKVFYTDKIEKNRIRIISACRMWTYHRIEWHFTDKAKEAIINAAQKS